MNKKIVTISAIVIAKNEEPRIAKCLEALSFCDERIVIDNGSTDHTKQIAKEMGAIVIESNALSFSSLHTIGKNAAKGTWLLYVDADETVSDQLKTSIVKILETDDKQAYRISRKNYYLGKEWPTIEHLVRLIRKNALIGWVGDLHETALTEGATGELNGYLIHDTHRTIEEMVEKTNIWSKTEAKLRYDAQHPKIVPWRLVRVFLTAFWDSYVTQGGWKSGTMGLIESMYQGFSIFITYAKLWELQKKS